MGKLKINPFKFQSDELELEATVEKIIGRTWFGYEDLMVLDRAPRSRAWMFLIDASGSIRGPEMQLSCLAVAAGILNLKKDDRYAVVGFNETPQIIKPFDTDVSLDAIVEAILSLAPSGCANIKAGLNWPGKSFRRYGRR